MGRSNVNARVSAPDPGATAVARVRAAVARALLAGPSHAMDAPLVLAVSGGRDSMVLMDAALAVAPERVAGVATFDHGTGPAAEAATAHVASAAQRRGVRCWLGHAPEGVERSEAGWRRARWQFLRDVARAVGDARSGRPLTVVATGHTADDQVETVLMRAMRGAGARGLAGMRAHTGGILRPLLSVSRAEVAAYAAACCLVWVDDPDNASRRRLRNRVRHVLLPALRGADPRVDDALRAIGEAAAGWRAEVHAVAAAVVDAWRGADDRLVVPLAGLAPYAPADWAVLWPSLAARVGVTLDRRAVTRLVAATARSVDALARGDVPTSALPLAGGARVTLERGDPASPERAMVVRRRPGPPSPPLGWAADEPPAALRPGTTAWSGPWRVTATLAAPGAPPAPGECWRVRLPAAGRYVVRAWRPGDRMPFRPDGTARRVKRFLADRRVPAAERAGWPVVVAEPAGVVVWIPGVRRSPAAPARPGEPGLDLTCERVPSSG